jgi:hypothetical protein
MGDAGHLPVSPERQHEVRTRRRQHLSVIGEGRWVPHLSRSSRDQTGVGVLDGDQLYVWHGDEVAEVSRVMERVPMAYFDRGDANGHGVLFMIGACDLNQLC